LAHNPGRCPGLASVAPLGLEKRRTKPRALPGASVFRPVGAGEKTHITPGMLLLVEEHGEFVTEGGICSG